MEALLKDYKLVDLSIPIHMPDLQEMDPRLVAGMAAEIDYLDHKATIPLVSGYFGCEPEELHNGVGWATERLRTSTHAAMGSPQEPSMNVPWSGISVAAWSWICLTKRVARPFPFRM